MNERQKKFVHWYFLTDNATEAAKRAGYSKKTAYSIGGENLKKPEISKALGEMRKKAATKDCMTREEWVMRWNKLANKKEPRIAIDALRELGKALGWYEPEKHSIDGSILVIE